jgi:hypothetical protein
MKRRFFRASIVPALCTAVLLGLASPAGAYSNNFDADTAGWFNNGPNTITQVASGYDNPAYADDINSASDGGHARLNRADCVEDGDPPGASIGPSVNCSGPFTYWGNGGQGNEWNGPYQTQVDIYLDAGYANVNEDSDVGNACLLTDPIPGDCKGTRFDYVSAINSSAALDGNGQATHLRDFGFIAGTGQPGNTCTGWVVNAQTNSTRDSAFPDDTSKNPVCITESGWYTFKHSFSDENGFLKVVMEIIPAGSATPAASWTITNIDPIETVGCNRYGWFSNQEISGLPIDNASMTGGCATTPHVGVIAPTGTTCQQYANTETTPIDALEQLQYTVRGTKINAVSPGAFFYYTKVSGDTTHRTVDITQDNDGATLPPLYPNIPILQGQVVLYDASTCKVVKWKVDLGPEVGEATGELPKNGDFIIGVKYNAAALKGAPEPASPPVTYTFGAELENVPFDEATIHLVPKPLI